MKLSLEDLDIVSVIPRKLYIAYFEDVDGVPRSRDLHTVEPH